MPLKAPETSPTGYISYVNNVYCFLLGWLMNVMYKKHLKFYLLYYKKNKIQYKEYKMKIQTHKIRFLGTKFTTIEKN